MGTGTRVPDYFHEVANQCPLRPAALGPEQTAPFHRHGERPGWAIISLFKKCVSDKAHNERVISLTLSNGDSYAGVVRGEGDNGIDDKMNKIVASSPKPVS